MSSTQRTIAIYIPLLTGSLSMMGSGSILYSIWARRETKLRDPQHRILGMMSLFDMFYSLCKALTFLLYPSGFGVPTFGNQSTCSMQGFFTQFGYAAGTYNLVLSLYYYLTINRGMKQKEFARVLEKVLHGTVVTLHLGFAIAGASIGLFNQTPAFCYIAPHPYGCVGHNDIPCERFGTTYPYFYEAFGQFWIQLAYVVIIITNLLIWLYVRSKEKEMEKYRMSIRHTHPDSKLNTMKKSSKHARGVFIQSMLYVGAFVLSWSWATIFHLIGWIGGVSAFWPTLLINIFLPLQGFWNAFIYARPRYLRIRKRRGSVSFVEVVKLAFLPPVAGEGQNAALSNTPSTSMARSRPTSADSAGTDRDRSVASSIFRNTLPSVWLGSLKFGAKSKKSRLKPNISDIVEENDSDHFDEEEEESMKGGGEEEDGNEVFSDDNNNNK